MHPHKIVVVERMSVQLRVAFRIASGADEAGFWALDTKPAGLYDGLLAQAAPSRRSRAGQENSRLSNSCLRGPIRVSELPSMQHMPDFEQVVVRQVWFVHVFSHHPSSNAFFNFVQVDRIPFVVLLRLTLQTDNARAADDGAAGVTDAEPVADDVTVLLFHE
ncbi:unnamed protein product [Mycena citricolor]|uniref:Uncharacterized protein n=1 Tax=Mycena citricolor TaxID=2018698 RepID=A0AAD2HP03_9AGAR|nr:unnamed protein product [Mycena citricolor]